MVKLRCFRASDLPGLAESWNNCFVGGPNYVRVTESDLLQDVVAQSCFESEDLLLGDDGFRQHGFVHFGARSNLWSTLAERRLNRAEGQIYMIVAPKGDRSLLSDLLAASESHLRDRGAKRIVLGPSWVYGAQPYYNGIAGAYEIPGLFAERDDVLAAALAQGFRPTAEYGTPHLSADKLSELSSVASNLWPKARAWGLRKYMRPVESLFFPPRVSVELIRGRETIAMTAFGLWEEYAREYGIRLYGLTSVQVATQWRGLGLGKLVMIEAMLSAQEQGAEGFHLHVWRKNEPAWNLYHRALGFEPAYRWLTLEKSLLS